VKGKKWGKKRKKSTPWILVIIILVVALLILVRTPSEEPSEPTTTMPETTTITPTTILTTTTPITTTAATTTLENVTTTIQVRKPISVIAYSCDYATDIITLTISNRGNTRIEEDEIEIYINDELIGTFGKAIEPGTLAKNSFQGSQGSNIIEAISPSNSVRIVKTCY